jgi:hypothetical protein
MVRSSNRVHELSGRRDKSFPQKLMSSSSSPVRVLSGWRSNTLLQSQRLSDRRAVAVRSPSRDERATQPSRSRFCSRDMDLRGRMEDMLEQCLRLSCIRLHELLRGARSEINSQQLSFSSTKLRRSLRGWMSGIALQLLRLMDRRAVQEPRPSREVREEQDCRSSSWRSDKWLRSWREEIVQKLRLSCTRLLMEMMQVRSGVRRYPTLRWVSCVSSLSGKSEVMSPHDEILRLASWLHWTRGLKLVILDDEASKPLRHWLALWHKKSRSDCWI